MRVCSRVAGNLAEQIRLGRSRTYFERNLETKLFAPIELEIDGKGLFIEGKIDRVDVEGGDIRIIDYKTRSDRLI